MKPNLRHVLAAVCGLVGCTGDLSGTASPVGGTSMTGGTGPAGGNGAVVPVTQQCTGAAPSVAAGKWRRLTALQYRNTVKDLLGVDADTSQFLQDTNTGPFATNSLLPPQDADIERYQSAAESIAAKAAADPAKLTKCDAKVTGEDACATQFIAEFGARAYRRPLSADEGAQLNKVYQAGKADSYAAGIRLVVEATLQSPNFLYLQEFGTAGSNGLFRLTGNEMAARLSYLLWNSPPDADLSAAAKSGQLDNVAGIRTQAQRLIASDRFLVTTNSFHSDLFGLSKLGLMDVVNKGPEFPEFDDAMKKAMQAESDLFFREVFAKGDGTLQTLLTASYGFPTGPLLKFYGLTAAPAGGKVNVTDGSRMGILTLPGVLAASPPLATKYAAVQRGKNIRFNLLCQEIPPPNFKVEFILPANADKLSQQEILREHLSNPTCSPCHQFMDPIGFGMENYDAIGRFRTRASDGGPIDATGEIVGMPDGKFDGPKALIGKLAQNKQVRECVATQWFRYALGRNVDPAADACSVRAIQDAMSAGNGDIRQSVLALIASDAFRFRKGN